MLAARRDNANVCLVNIRKGALFKKVCYSKWCVIEKVRYSKRCLIQSGVLLKRCVIQKVCYSTKGVLP